MIRIAPATVPTIALLSLVACDTLAVPTVAPFDINAGGGAVFTEFDPQGGSDSLSILPTDGATFVIEDATIGGATDAFDGIFEIAVGVDGTSFFTVTDDDGTVDLTAGAAGSRVVIDAVGDAGFPAGFDVDVEYFVFANEPLALMVFSVTNSSGASAAVAVEVASDSGTGAPVNSATASGDMVLDNSDTWHVRTDDGLSPDPLQTHVQFGVGAPATPSIVRIDPSDDDDTQVLFDLVLAAGETQSLMYFAAVTDPNSPTALDDAVALATQLDGTLIELGAAGFLAGLEPGTIGSIVNYAVPEPVSLALLVLGGAAFAVKRRLRVSRGASR